MRSNECSHNGKHNECTNSKCTCHCHLVKVQIKAKPVQTANTRVWDLSNEPDNGFSRYY